MKLIQTILRGLGQVMFQNNIYSGALFLIGIFYNSWHLGLAAIFGALISTLTAQALKYPSDDIQNGLYGFNGALTGIALLYFFETDAGTIAALVVGAVLSTLLMRLLKNLISPLTAPFVIVTWLAIYSLLFIFNYSLLSFTIPTGTDFNLLSASSKSFGQVMFQENIITGVFFLLGIVVNDRFMAIYSLYGAILASLTGLVIAEYVPAINAGLMGYNAVLCAIALTGKRKVDFLWITLAILLSTLLNVGLAKTGIITLTTPFVIVTWGILLLKKTEKLVLRRRFN